MFDHIILIFVEYFFRFLATTISRACSVPLYANVKEKNISQLWCVDLIILKQRAPLLSGGVGVSDKLTQ